jgi:hypothetical protein
MFACVRRCALAVRFRKTCLQICFVRKVCAVDHDPEIGIRQCFPRFSAVACTAGKAQVSKIVVAAVKQRLDVIDNEIVRRAAVDALAPISLFESRLVLFGIEYAGEPHRLPAIPIIGHAVSTTTTGRLYCADHLNVGSREQSSGLARRLTGGDQGLGEFINCAHACTCTVLARSISSRSSDFQTASKHRQSLTFANEPSEHSWLPFPSHLGQQQCVRVSVIGKSPRCSRARPCPL